MVDRFINESVKRGAPAGAPLVFGVGGDHAHLQVAHQFLVCDQNGRSTLFFDREHFGIEFIFIAVEWLRQSLDSGRAASVLIYSYVQTFR
jgi:hypothetical protein